MNLAELLRTQAQRRPDAPALIDATGGRTRHMTFLKLDMAASRAADLLWQRGLRPGDGVLLFHPISTELYVALAAIFRLGLTAIFVDPSMGKAHIERCCERAGPKALFATPKAHLLRLNTPALGEIPIKFATGLGVPGATPWRLWRTTPPLETIHPCEVNTPALATFTSGSTGRPKMAIRTHGFLQKQHAVLEESLVLTPDDVVVTTLPIFVLSHLGSGVCTLIPNVDLRHPGRVRAGPVVQQIEAYGVTCIESSPAFLEQIVRHCAGADKVLPNVSKVFTGGAPVFPGLLEQTQAIAPHADVVAVYGSTEAEPIAHMAYAAMDDADRRAMQTGGGLLVGPPVDAIQVRILPDQWGNPLGPYTEAEFATLPLAANTPGEIIVSGPHVLAGYWRGAGDRETKVRVGDTIWHRTGDAGYLDEQGRLWLLGRCSARIEDRLGVLYPFAVECAVDSFPEVKRAAFVRANRQRLLILELYPMPPSGFVEPAFPDKVAAALRWAHIAEVRVVGEIPVDKRHNAKIDYPALERMLAQGDGKGQAAIAPKQRLKRVAALAANEAREFWLQLRNRL